VSSISNFESRVLSGQPPLPIRLETQDGIRSYVSTIDIMVFITCARLNSSAVRWKPEKQTGFFSPSDGVFCCALAVFLGEGFGKLFALFSSGIVLIDMMTDLMDKHITDEVGP
jgi:hypothetical protein